MSKAGILLQIGLAAFAVIPFILGAYVVMCSWNYIASGFYTVEINFWEATIIEIILLVVNKFKKVRIALVYLTSGTLLIMLSNHITEHHESFFPDTTLILIFTAIQVYATIKIFKYWREYNEKCGGQEK